MGNWYLGNYKKEGETSLCVLTRDAKKKKKMIGPSGPLYARKY